MTSKHTDPTGLNLTKSERKREEQGQRIDHCRFAPLFGSMRQSSLLVLVIISSCVIISVYWSLIEKCRYFKKQLSFLNVIRTEKGTRNRGGKAAVRSRGVNMAQWWKNPRRRAAPPRPTKSQDNVNAFASRISPSVLPYHFNRHHQRILWLRLMRRD